MRKPQVIRRGGRSAAPKRKSAAVGRGSTPPPATNIESWKVFIAHVFKDGYTVAKIAEALSFKRLAVEEVLREYMKSKRGSRT